MLCTTATNTSNTIRTQTGAAVSLIHVRPMSARKLKKIMKNTRVHDSGSIAATAQTVTFAMRVTDRRMLKAKITKIALFKLHIT